VEESNFNSFLGHSNVFALGVMATWNDDEILSNINNTTDNDDDFRNTLPGSDTTLDKATIQDARKAIKMYVLSSVLLFMTNFIPVLYPFGLQYLAFVFS
jgi:hypothetical protein